MTAPLLSVVGIVTRFAPGPYGGGIVFASDDQSAAWSIVLPSGCSPKVPAAGEHWRFNGSAHETRPRRLRAHNAWPLIPRGRVIVEYLASNPRFVGVGRAYAQRLWKHYGDRLYELLHHRDTDALATVVGPFLAASIVLGWGLYIDEVETLAWLDRHGVAPRTAARAVALWGVGARGHLEADPYALCLLESWRHVDSTAQRTGISPDDERRLLAAVEEAGARRFARKHTAFTLDELRRELRPLLPGPFARVERAITLAIAARRLYELDTGIYQARGPHEMERLLIDELLRRSEQPPDALCSSVLDIAEQTAGPALTELQSQAVRMAISHQLSVLCGGAGTGKTTVLRAVIAAARAVHGEAFPVHQAALSGRAAKRMTEATGAPALTVFRLLMALRREELPANEGLLILDEASMLDLPTVYSIMRAVGPAKRLLFVGDPAQLPPIGPGLVFHRMIGNPRIAQIELSTIHRQTNATGIPAAGAMVRTGRCPALTPFDFAKPHEQGVFLAHARDAADVARTTLDVIEALAGPQLAWGVQQRDLQLLCAVRRGPAGSEALNEAIETRHCEHAPRNSWGLQLCSKIVWLVNDHQRGTREQPRSLLNGAIGYVTSISEECATVYFDDGSIHQLRRSDLAKLERGWVISIHKAQGSAFRHVVVPIVSSALLDRSLLYTAVTRATLSVILVGERRVLEDAIARPPIAGGRRVALQFDDGYRDACLGELLRPDFPCSSPLRAQTLNEPNIDS